MAPVFCPRAEERASSISAYTCREQSMKYCSDNQRRKFSVRFGLRCQTAAHIFGSMGYEQGEKSFGTLTEREKEM